MLAVVFNRYDQQSSLIFYQSKPSHPLERNLIGLEPISEKNYPLTKCVSTLHFPDESGKFQMEMRGHVNPNFSTWHGLFLYLFGYLYISKFQDRQRIMKIQQSDLYYMAGLMDGEGTITLTKSGNWRFPSIQMTSTSYELIEYLVNTFGGKVNKRTKYKSHHKESWVWCLRHNAALDFCYQIEPYLKEKSKLRRCKILNRLYKKVTVRNGKYSKQQKRNKERFERLFFILV